MTIKLPRLLANQNLYQLLEIDDFSDPEAVKRGFRNLALKYHPDRAPQDREAQGRFLLGAEAYRILRDRSRKRAYDRHLKRMLSNRFGYRQKTEGGQGEKSGRGLYIRCYTKENSGGLRTEERLENLMDVLARATPARRGSKVYHPQAMDAVELEAMVREGRDHFKSYLNSLPKLNRA